MTKIKLYQISEVAAASKVTVRTLHHYDQIGLLKPVDRTGAGYRLYDQESLLRLQQILIYQKLGLSLEHIRSILDDPKFDLATSLKQQLAQLLSQADATAAAIKSVQNALAEIQSVNGGKTMKLEDIFSGFDPARYQPEVESRWGDTEMYQQAKLRTRTYKAEDWQAIKAEQDAVFSAGAALLASGVASNDLAVFDVIERHRQFIDRWFYPCSKDFQQNLADMWEGDERFKQSMDAYGQGLTDFLVQGIRSMR